MSSAAPNNCSQDSAALAPDPSLFSDFRSVGEFQFYVFSALAEFERDLLIRDRNMAGLCAARARGRLGGRLRRLTLEQVKMAAHLIQDPG